MKTKKQLKSGLHALIWQEGKWYVAKCLEIEIASQGLNQNDALKNLEEALSLYFEDEKIVPPEKLINPRLMSLGFAYA